MLISNFFKAEINGDILAVTSKKKLNTKELARFKEI